MTSTPPEEHAPPALFDHCVRTYNAMLADAKRHKVEGDNNEHVIIYEGFLTRLITQKLNLSVPYYTKIRNALIRMGCVRQLKRGGGSSPSQWEMIYEPSLEAFLRQEAPKVPKQDKYAALEQQISNLTTRIADLERSRDEMVTAFAQKFGVEELEDKDV